MALWHLWCHVHLERPAIVEANNHGWNHVVSAEVLDCFIVVMMARLQNCELIHSSCRIKVS